MKYDSAEVLRRLRETHKPSQASGGEGEQDSGWDWAHPPVNSLLFTLWQKWQSGQDNPDQVMDLTLQRADFPPLPLSDKEMQLESRRFSLRLMAGANERYKLHSTGSGELIGQADAKAFIHVASNRMAAWMLVFPPINGGSEIQWEQLQDALQEYSVVAGIDETALRRIVEEQLYFKLIPIARGSLPGQSEDGYIEEYFPREKPKAPENLELTARLAAQYIQPIKKGDVICRLIPPKSGEPGTDVLGTVLPGAAGQSVSLSAGRNTILNSDGAQIADVDGHILFEGSHFHVQPLQIVDGDLDKNSEHIVFDGDVSIRGDVLEHAVIQATGSVMITGLVEGAVIRAGGNVIIAAGVLGDERAMIRAKGSVWAKYLEKCVVYAGGPVEVDCIIDSHVYSDDRISVLEGRGTIIGGKVSAAYTIEAKTIGSKAERCTEVVLGEFPCMEDERQDLSYQLEEIQDEYEQVDKKMARLEQQESSSDQLMHLAKLRLRRATLAIQEDRLKKQMEALRSSCDDLSQCHLRADILYPVTEVTIGGVTDSVKNMVVSCFIRLHGRQIRIRGDGVV